MKIKTGFAIVLTLASFVFLMSEVSFADDWDTSTSGQVTTSGDVGIGTSNPEHTLDVVGHDIEFTRSNHSMYFNPNWLGNGTHAIITTNTDIDLRLGANTTSTPNQLVLASDGNVGIGTTGPQEKLEVSGNFKINGNIVSDGDICIGNCD